MSEGRPETRNSCNFSTSHGAGTNTHDDNELSENQKILTYMDNVFSRISRTPSTRVILVSRNTKFLKTNMITEKAKFSYANISGLTEKIRTVASKLLNDENIESIRLKGSKHGEIFITFDEYLDIIVFDRKLGR